MSIAVSSNMKFRELYSLRCEWINELCNFPSGHHKIYISISIFFIICPKLEQKPVFSAFPAYLTPKLKGNQISLNLTLLKMHNSSSLEKLSQVLFENFYFKNRRKWQQQLMSPPEIIITAAESSPTGCSINKQLHTTTKSEV